MLLRNDQSKEGFQGIQLMLSFYATCQNKIRTVIKEVGGLIYTLSNISCSEVKICATENLLWILKIGLEKYEFPDNKYKIFLTPEKI